MGVRFLEGTYDGTQHGATVLVDSVSGWAFGPLFDSVEDAQAFCDWFDTARFDDVVSVLDLRRLGRQPDPRAYTESELQQLYVFWLRQRQEVEAR